MLNPYSYLTPIKTGSNREGIGFKEEDIRKAIIMGAANWALINSRPIGSNIKTYEGIYIMSDVEEAYKNANDVIGKAQDQYNKIVQSFRGSIKNDLTSISSSADKTVKECEKIQKSYVAVAELLTTDKMEQAIKNAERLANALSVLAEVKSTELNLTLLDKGAK